MKPETIAALELLYGGSETPVCAATQQLSLLWQSGGSAADLLALLRRQLGETETTGAVRIPPDHTAVLSYADPPVLCRMEQLTEDGTPYYIIRFLPLTQQRKMNQPELRALLDRQVRAGGRAALVAMQAAHKIEDTVRHHKLTVEPDVMRMLYESCYTMLNREARWEELLWYESVGSGENENAVQFGSVDISALLRQYAGELHNVTDGLMHLEKLEIAEGLYAAVEPKRLQFALLTVFVLLQAGNPARAAFSLSAQQQEAEIRIVMTLHEPRNAGKTQAPFRRLTEPDGTLLSEDAVLRQFCAVFRADFKQISMQAGSISGILTLPAAPPQDTVQLRSPLARYTKSKSTLTHVLLSTVISAAYYFDMNE